MLSSLTGRFMMISCAMVEVCLPRPPLSVRCHTLAANLLDNPVSRKGLQQA
jgi:hypothetical protein